MITLALLSLLWNETAVEVLANFVTCVGGQGIKRWTGRVGWGDRVWFVDRRWCAEAFPKSWDVAHRDIGKAFRRIPCCTKQSAQRRPGKRYVSLGTRLWTSDLLLSWNEAQMLSPEGARGCQRLRKDDDPAECDPAH